MAVKENDEKTFNSYYETAIQLFAEGKPIPKEMLTYWFYWRTVAYILAFLYDTSPYWQTDDKEILVLKINSGNTVAHNLALWHPSWVTNDPEILFLKGYENKTVKEILIEKIMTGKKHDS